ncbi:MAG: hypothetical protein PHW10_03350 [Candidatus Peribacteraceae bacterium]|nr:hypothetical protein [Candidatus Peribacteraceae bacterium]
MSTALLSLERAPESAPLDAIARRTKETRNRIAHTLRNIVDISGDAAYVAADVTGSTLRNLIKPIAGFINGVLNRR